MLQSLQHLKYRMFAYLNNMNHHCVYPLHMYESSLWQVSGLGSRGVSKTNCTQLNTLHADWILPHSAVQNSLVGSAFVRMTYTWKKTCAFICIWRCIHFDFEQFAIGRLVFFFFSSVYNIIMPRQTPAAQPFAICIAHQDAGGRTRSWRSRLQE